MVGESFNCIASADDIHQRHTRNLSYTPPEFPITSSDNIALVRSDALHQAVICICSGVTAAQSLEPWVSGDTSGGCNEYAENGKKSYLTAMLHDIGARVFLIQP